MFRVISLKISRLSGIDIIKHSITVLLFLTLLSVLVEGPFLYFYHVTGKNFFFRSIIEIALILYLLLIIWDRSYLPRRSHLWLAFAGFMGVVFFANVLGENPEKSFFSNFERMEGYLALLHFAAYLLITSAIFRSRAVWTLFWQASFLISVAVGLQALVSDRVPVQHMYSALIESFNDTKRISGSLGNSTYLGVYALLHIFIAGFLSARTLSQSSSLLMLGIYTIGGVFNGWVLFRTGTRGAFVGLIAGALLWGAFIYFQKLREAKFKKAKGIVLGALVLVVVFFGLLVHLGNTSENPIVLRYANLVSSPQTLFNQQDGGRFHVWRAAFNGWVERPVLGWGQENFNYVYDKYHVSEALFRDSFFDRAHNVLFEWLVAAGALGLLGFLSLYAALLWMLWKLPKDAISINERTVLTAMLVAHFVHNLFVFDHLVSYLLFFSVMAFIQSEHERTLPPVPAQPWINSAPIRYCVMLLIVVIGAISFYTINIVPFKSNLYIYRAYVEHTARSKYRAYDEISMNRVYNNYVKALSYNTIGKSDILDQLSASVLDLSQWAEIGKRKQLYELAVSELKQMHAEDPTNCRLMLSLGLVLISNGNYHQALPYFQKLHEISPGRLIAQAYLGIAYFNIGVEYKDAASYDAAFKIFQKLYTDYPDFQWGRHYYATALLYRANYEEYDALLAKHPDLSVTPLVLKALLDTKSYSRAILPLESVYSKQPEYALLMHLTEAYLKTDMRDKALLLLARVEKQSNHPQTLSQVSKMIKAIQSGASSVDNPEPPQQKP